MNPTVNDSQVLAPASELEARLSAAFADAGASAESAASAVRALMHASRLGVDSHGARLIVHYDKVLRGGRVNRTPRTAFRQTAASTGIVDGDDGLGHHSAYEAMSKAIELAGETGIGAVGVVRSSHLGAAGAYAKAAADAGMLGFATTNTDAVVVPFSGTKAIHGTNPLAFAAPSGGMRPWLVDMATSSIPLNRVLLYNALGMILPQGVATDNNGDPTLDPSMATMLLPLGGIDYAFKGAALAGVATVFSAVLQGTTLDHDFIPMVGSDDISTPRNMGHFMLAIDPARFGGQSAFAAGMAAYLAALRAVPARNGVEVLAPGDREWRVEAQRLREGIPLDRETASFLKLSNASPANAGSTLGEPVN